MARRSSDKARVLGPYAENGVFRIVFVKADGTRESSKFSTEDDARNAIENLQRLIAQSTTTIRDALREYAVYMRDDKGNKPNSIEQTGHKLRRFFDVLDVGLTTLTPEKCGELYDALRRSQCKPQRRAKDGEPVVVTRPISVDYHRNALSEARTFLKWCVKRKWLATNPLAHIEGVGRRHHGKEQLRIDEARKWLAKGIELADQDHEGAVAALMTLLMGMRCSEVISRVARDLDDDGRLLWIPDAKTPKGKRTLQIPEILRPYLAELAEGKKAEALLFGLRDRGWPRQWVKRICREAGVPEVTAHGQRGLHSTLAVEAGITARAVADALGHESFTTTARSYAKPEAIDRARQQRTLQVLQGGLGRDEVAA